MAHTYPYPRPAITADTVLIGIGPDDVPRVLLIRRQNAPFAGEWALPGGYVEMDERLEAAARRELKEETGLTFRRSEPLGIYDDVHRDPRGRTMSAVFLALTHGLPQPRPGDDALDARWFDLDAVPPLAFDHDEILSDARDRLTRLVRTLQPVAVSAR